MNDIFVVVELLLLRLPSLLLLLLQRHQVGPLLLELPLQALGLPLLLHLLALVLLGGEGRKPVMTSSRKFRSGDEWMREATKDEEATLTEVKCGLFRPVEGERFTGKNVSANLRAFGGFVEPGSKLLDWVQRSQFALLETLN